LEAFDLSSNPITATVDRDGMVVSVSEEWGTLARDVAILFADLERGQNIFEHRLIGGRFAPTRCREFAQGLRGVLDGTVPSVAITYPASTSGERVWLDLSATPAEDGNGAVITHRPVPRSHEETAREHRELSLLLMGLAEAVVAVDFDGRIKYINHNAEEMYGFTLAEVYGEMGAEVTKAIVMGEDQGAILERLRAGKSWYGEVSVTTQQDRTFPGHVSTAPVFDLNNEPVAIITLIRDVTEFAEANRAVAAGEIRYRELFEASPMPTWVYDAETLEFLMVNRMAIQTYGYTEEEFLQMTVRQIRPPEDYELFDQAAVGLADKGRVSGFWRHLTKQGEMLEVEVFSEMFLHEGRRARLSVVKDVTESHRAARALQRKTQQQAAVADLGRKAIGNRQPIDLMNKAVEIVAEMFQARLSGILELQPDGDAFKLVAGTGWESGRIGTQVSSISIGGQSAYTLKTRQPVIVTDLPTETRFDNRHLLPEYGIRSGISIAILVDGEPWGILTVQTTESKTFSEEDVHFFQSVANIISVAIQQHRANEALRHSEERFQSIARAATDAMWDWDLADNTLWWSDGMYHLFGFAIDELEPDLDSWTTRLHPDDREPVSQSLLDAAESGDETWTSEYRFLRKDGTYAHVVDRGFMIRDENGVPIRMMGGMTDVSAEVEAESLQEQLRESQKMEAIGTLAGGIAHDFNNILTSILGNISMLRLSGVAADHESHHILAEAERAAKRAKDLTHQLLTFAKGGAPVKTLARVGDLVEETVSFALRGSASRCEFQVPPDLWAAEVDVGQIGQVLQNLVINADQAMPEGGVLTVRADNVCLRDQEQPGLPAGPYLRIAVTDTGHGIPAKHLERIFDPYFTTKSKGSGLGLTTSFSIVRKHGGHLTVQSEVGRGSCFTLWLPAREHLVLPAVPDPQGPGATTAGEGRLLVMDDEPAIRDLTQRMLERKGFEVVTTSHGEEAIACYQQARAAGRPFRAVILDLTIPGGLGGRDTFQRLKALDPSVRALVASGYSDQVLAETLALGFAGVVPKPFTAAELLQAVGQALAPASSGKP